MEPARIPTGGSEISRGRSAGLPSSAAIIATLADRHAKDDVVRTLMRLAVTGRLVETGGRYTPRADA